MPTPFDALDSLLSGAVNSVFGEVFLFEAFKTADDVDLPKIADTSRAAFSAIAVWVEQSRSTTPHARGALQDDNAHNWTASHPELTIDDANLSWRPQPGDRVTRVETGSVYQISRPPRPDGMGHTTIQLSERKR